MVAIVIGMILVGGAISLLVTSKQTYIVQEDLARLQESGRFALEMMGRDIRMAGYAGCANDMTAVTNNVEFQPGDLRDMTLSIEGFEGSASTAWAPSDYPINRLASDDSDSAACGEPVVSQRDPLSDAITLRHLGGASAELVETMPNPNNPLFVEDLATSQLALEQGTVVAVTDCATTDVFTIGNNPNDNLNAGSGKRTIVAKVEKKPGLSKVYSHEPPNVARITSATGVRYFVARSSAAETDPKRANENSLWRQTLTAGCGGTGYGRVRNQELLEGVHRLEIRYGVDADDDGVADDFLNADQVDEQDWTRVAAVRVALLMRTTGNRDPELSSAQAQQLRDPVNGGLFLDGSSAGGTLPAEDRARYRVMASTFYIRNNSQ